MPGNVTAFRAHETSIASDVCASVRNQVVTLALMRSLHRVPHLRVKHKSFGQWKTMAIVRFVISRPKACC